VGPVQLASHPRRTPRHCADCTVPASASPSTTPTRSAERSTTKASVVVEFDLFSLRAGTGSWLSAQSVRIVPALAPATTPNASLGLRPFAVASCSRFRASAIVSTSQHLGSCMIRLTARTTRNGSSGPCDDGDRRSDFKRTAPDVLAFADPAMRVTRVPAAVDQSCHVRSHRTARHVAVESRTIVLNAYGPGTDVLCRLSHTRV
jgi:hypothetical protein